MWAHYYGKNLQNTLKNFPKNAVFDIIYAILKKNVKFLKKNLDTVSNPW